MESKQTAVEYYDKIVSDIFQEFVRDEITKTELIVKIHSAYYPALKLEKDQMKDFVTTFLSSASPAVNNFIRDEFEKYYNETYGK